jgi:hypothetical protein
MNKSPSSLIRDPVIRAAFARAERDYHQTFAIPDEAAAPNTLPESSITHRSTTMNHRQIPVVSHSLSINQNHQCTGEQTTSPVHPASAVAMSRRNLLMNTAVTVASLASATALASSSALAPAMPVEPDGWDARAALARLEQVIEALRTCVVCEGWHPNGLDEATAARALAYFRAGCPEESDEDFVEREAAFDFISGHGQSIDWIILGDPVGLICRAAEHSRRAQSVLGPALGGEGAELLALGAQFKPIEDEYWAQTAIDRAETVIESEDEPWDGIHDRLYPLANEIWSKKAQTISGLALQTRAIVLAAHDLWDPGMLSDNDHERKFIEAVCAFVGITPYEAVS